MFPYKKVSVLGLGKTGLAIANLLASRGVEVFVSESSKEDKATENIRKLDKKIGHETAGHTEKILKSDIIIKSPGIRSDLPILAAAKSMGIQILSELEISSTLITPRHLIAVTGTNGKTTATTMIGDIFTESGCKTVVSGNIGTPLASYVDLIDTETAVVVEVSSYQLEDTLRFHPDICCVLNVTPDHLEHHNSMDNYLSAKKDYCILNYDDELCRKMAAKARSTVIFTSQNEKLEDGIFYENHEVLINLPALKITNIKVPLVLRVPGSHNVENALVSMAAGLAAGIEPVRIAETLGKFKGVEHRIELVREVNGVKYINDSKSTNVDSTLVALKSFSGDILLIMGGRHKGAPYTPLKQLVKDKVKKLLLIGESSGIIKKDIGSETNSIEAGTLEKALEYAYNTAKKGDAVLLSPGCSSFDQFENFEHRGSEFKRMVNSLPGNQ